MITPQHSPALGDAVTRLLAGEHHDPHSVLGVHPRDGGGAVVRAFHPRATAAWVVVDGTPTAMVRLDPRGLYEAVLTTVPTSYWLRMRDGEHIWEADDPYRFLPTLGELDLHLISQGQHHQLWTRLGAQVLQHQGVAGTAFAVWAPNARGVRVVGDMGGWDERLHPMRTLGASGVWELFIPGVAPGARYKFDVTRADGGHILKADPLARAAQPPPATASVVTVSSYSWNDSTWMTDRASARWEERPVSIYEAHLGSWRRGQCPHRTRLDL